jgi:cell shape-determining protein MreC
MKKGQKRHEVPVMNGFRRFWNKACKESLSRDSPLASLIKKEFMMGHTGLVKFDRNYFKTQVLELAEEYLNAVSNLTISDEERTKAENRQLRKEKSERAKTELDILYLKDEVARLRQSMEHTKKQKSKS